MLKALSTRLLQHLITQNSWAHAMLQPFAGQSVRITVGFVAANVVILEDGNLALVGETNVPDATATIAPSLLLRLLAKDEAANRQIKIEGDMHLAAAFAKVFSNMRWDYEDDLSHVIGDIPANKLGEFARSTAHSLKATSTNLAEMLSEYWQEELPLIAKKRHVEAFNAEVDTLRSDVARLEKRLSKLSANPSQQSTIDSIAVDNTH